MTDLIQNIYYMRHAETPINIGAAHGPNARVGLTPKGERDVAELAYRLSLSGFIQGKPDIVYMSDMDRALLSAKGVKTLYPSVECKIWPAISEFVYMDAKDGSVITQSEKDTLSKEFWRTCNIDKPAIEGCETFQSHTQRVQHSMSALFADNRNAIFCVGHGYTMQQSALFALGRLDEATPTAMSESRTYERLDNLDILHIRRNRETGQVWIDRRLFAENYLNAHEFPVLEARHRPVLEGKPFF